MSSTETNLLQGPQILADPQTQGHMDGSLMIILLYQSAGWYLYGHKHHIIVHSSLKMCHHGVSMPSNEL